mgnify:CR=1 FL=1
MAVFDFRIEKRREILVCYISLYYVVAVLGYQYLHRYI